MGRIRVSPGASKTPLTNLERVSGKKIVKKHLDWNFFKAHIFTVKSMAKYIEKSMSGFRFEKSGPRELILLTVVFRLEWHRIKMIKINTNMVLGMMSKAATMKSMSATWR